MTYIIIPETSPSKTPIAHSTPMHTLLTLPTARPIITTQNTISMVLGTALALRVPSRSSLSTFWVVCSYVRKTCDLMLYITMSTYNNSRARLAKHSSLQIIVMAITSDLVTGMLSGFVATLVMPSARAIVTVAAWKVKTLVLDLHPKNRLLKKSLIDMVMVGSKIVSTAKCNNQNDWNWQEKWNDGGSRRNHQLKREEASIQFDSDISRG